MRAWTIMLGGLAVWAAHFFTLYGIASLLPGRPEARWLVLAATLTAVAANGLLLWKTTRGANEADSLDRWTSQLGASGAAVSLVAVIWQCVPALA